MQANKAAISLVIGDCYKSGEHKCYYYGNYRKMHSSKEIVIDVEVGTTEDNRSLRNHHEDPMQLPGVHSLPACYLCEHLLNNH